MKDILYQLDAVKTNLCILSKDNFNSDVINTCISNLKEYEKGIEEQFIRLHAEAMDYHAEIQRLKDELTQTKRERDAAVADLTEFLYFYRRRTICDFCKHDAEEGCTSEHKNNHYINDCFEWRGMLNEY